MLSILIYSSESACSCLRALLKMTANGMLKVCHILQLIFMFYGVHYASLSERYLSLRSGEVDGAICLNCLEPNWC